MTDPTRTATSTSSHLTIRSIYTHAAWNGNVELGDGTSEQKLERAFRLFNRVDDADGERLESWGYRLPSMSVGDCVSLTPPGKKLGEATEHWIVMPFGFSRLEDVNASRWPEGANPLTGAEEL